MPDAPPTTAPEAVVPRDPNCLLTLEEVAFARRAGGSVRRSPMSGTRTWPGPTGQRTNATCGRSRSRPPYWGDECARPTAYDRIK